MNHLKHILGKPVCQPSGLALRGSALARSAGTGGNHSKRSAKILVATRDSDDSTDLKLSSRSYAKLIRDYSDAIDVRQPITKINAEPKTNRGRGFFSKSPFQRLTRVSSLVHAKSCGNNGGPSLCTKSSSRPLQDSIRRNAKINKSKLSTDDNDARNEAAKRAEWLDRVVTAHNAKRAAKSVSSSDNYAQGKNLAHHLVQKLPESRATRKAIPKDVHDTRSSFVKNPSGSSVTDTSKMSRAESKLSKSISDASVHCIWSLKKVPSTSASDAKIVPRKSSAKSKVTPKVVNEGHRSPAKKFSKASATDLKNTSKSSTSCKRVSKNSSNTSLRSAVLKDLSVVPASNAKIAAGKSSATNTATSKAVDEGHSSPAKKLPTTSATDPHNLTKPSKSEKNISRSTSGASVRSSFLKRLSGAPPSDTKITRDKSTPLKKTSQKSSLDARECHCSSGKKVSDTSASDTSCVSVVIERLRTVDKADKHLLTQKSGDSDPMIVTVTGQSQSSSTAKASPLRHVDFQINGKPASGTATLINKADKLNLISSADKIEITIPIPSKFEGAFDDNLRAPRSIINLCVSATAGQTKDYVSGSSRSDALRPSTLAKSTPQKCKKVKALNLSKVVPWWTTSESFRHSEVVSARSTRAATINKSATVKALGVGKSSARGNQEARDRGAKEVAVSDAGKPLKFLITKPYSPRQQQQQQQQSKSKRSSIVSRIIGTESPKKSERDEKGPRKVDERVTPERPRPEAKAETKVSGTASKVPRREPLPVVVATTMPGKSARTSTPTPDRVSKKMTASLGSTVTAPGGKSIANAVKPKNNPDANGNNNLSKANTFRGRARTASTPKTAKRDAEARREGATTSVEQGSKGATSDGKTEPRTRTKPHQEVASKAETKSSTQIPRTYGRIKTLPPSQDQKVVNRANDNHRAPVKSNEGTASTSDKVAGFKKPTVTMRPIEKKKDGTLIDYGLTVNTRKKSERKLSGPETAATLQPKKLTGQKGVVVATNVEEDALKGHRDTRGHAIKRRGSSQDTARSRMSGGDKNRRRTSGTISTGGRRSATAKGTIMKPSESANSRTSVKSGKKNSKASDDSQVVEAATQDKQLLYSVWLRQFKEKTGQDSDPTNDPSSKNS